MSLHVMGESRLEGARFHMANDREPANAAAEIKRSPAGKPKRLKFERYPSPNPSKISNP